MTQTKWSSTIALVDEAWEKFKTGGDFDASGKLYVEKIEVYINTLKQSYRHNAQGDDRPHAYLRPRKIGLDIDEVLADWVGAWKTKHGMTRDVHCWNFDWEMDKRNSQMKESREYWTSIPKLIKPEDLPFEPHAYITARSIPIEWTKEWLFEINHFPFAPVYSVGFGESKVEVAKASGVEVFVDDSYKNFVELNNAGILTYLWDAAHNRKYDVGYKRLKNLKDLI